MAVSLCHVCQRYVTVGRDHSNRSMYLELHTADIRSGHFPCQGSGQYIIEMERPPAAEKES
jgi:hypothetical protein